MKNILVNLRGFSDVAVKDWPKNSKKHVELRIDKLEQK